ncbi:MAG: type II toxin-antitoxin system VapC family toxin [Deltaproteobacteria bacterium]
MMETTSSPSVYLETTIPSYLASRLSSYMIVAAQQLITRDWWDGARFGYDLYVSEAVLEECRAGDPEMAVRRMEIVHTIPLLAITDHIILLAADYQALLGIPEKSKVDALHLAFAVGYEIDYLLTWNCRHLAHGEVRTRIHRYSQTKGLHEPMIVTPQELLERSEP